MKKWYWIVIVLLVIWNLVLTSIVTNNSPSQNEQKVTKNEVIINGYSTDVSRVIQKSVSKLVVVNNMNIARLGFVYDVIDNDVYIVTTLQDLVVEDGVQVTFDNYQSVKADIVGYDEVSNLLLLKTNVDFELETFNIGDSDVIVEGNFIVGLGLKPSNLYRITTNIGFVLENTNYNETSAFNKTNFYVSDDLLGGPVINIDGDLIGIMNTKSSSFMPINELKLIVDTLIDTQVIIRKEFNIGVSEIRGLRNYEKAVLNIPLDINEGIYIYSGNDEIGLKTGMIIKSINGQNLETIYDYQEAIINNYVFDLEVIVNNEVEKVHLEFHD